MHEKTGKDEVVGKILDTKCVQSMDPHNRHKLAKRMQGLSLNEILKKFPHFRYE